MTKKLKDNALLAIAFASLNAFMLGGMSLSAKWLGEYFGAIEVTFWRNLASIILLFIWFAIIRNSSFYKTNRPKAHIFRGIIGTVGIVLGMYTVSVLSLAETTVLLFTSPLFTLLLSIIFLKESVGIYRIGAILVGFIGVAITALPGILDNINPFPILGLAAGLGWGFCSGSVDTVLRWMGKTEDAYTTTFYFMLFGTIACGLYWPFSATPIASIQPDSITTVAGVIILLGITGTIALLAKTQSYRLGEASLVAPIMYTMMIWSLLFDYIFWQRIPTWNVVLGAMIIVASNLFIMYRENIKKSKITASEGLQG